MPFDTYPASVVAVDARGDWDGETDVPPHAPNAIMAAADVSLTLRCILADLIDPSLAP
jgi:hypothetical protein